MFQKLVFFISALFFTNSVFAAGGAQLVGVKGALKNLEKTVNSAVAKSEELFEQNAGVALTADMDMLTGSAANPFISFLKIIGPASGSNNPYEVHLQFAGTSWAARSSFYESAATSGSNATEPLPQILRGVKINLIPIYESGDIKINSWECTTDADTNAVTFIGSNTEPMVGSTSLISLNANPGTNPYLSNCIYVDTPW